MSAQQPRGPRTFRNGIWLSLICSLLSIFLIFKLSPGFSLGMSFAQIHWGYFLIGFPVLFLVWFSKAYRMFVIAQGMGIEVELGTFLKIYLATCFISHITPFSSGGTPLQIYLIGKQGVSLGKATAITAVDLGLHSAFFVLLVPLAILLNLNLLGTTLLKTVIATGRKWFLILLIGIAIIYFLFRWRPLLDWMGRVKWLQGLRSHTPLAAARTKWLRNLRHEWELFREGWFTLVRQNPASIGWAMMATLIYWLFYFLLAPLIIWSLGKQASFLSLIGRQMLYNFGQILIPTPGGSGGSELILTYLFRSITGVTLVGPFVFFWKLYTFYCTLIMGGFYFFKLTSGVVEQK